ncbi:MAG: hypothetical protein KYX66_06785 [Blastomonas fulva]|uniref:hypothetical protein n=1 Tax=Blastomonas fulva TaxID=1550728 RepID=UPI0024E20523|nr:hypothetical protein [Blastomonas fulva]MDK2756425.1 hypothetical protein [Blastomonas fulva]
MTDIIRGKMATFLKDKKATPNCSSCGSNNWTVPDDEMAMLRLPIFEQGNIISMPGPAIPAYIMLCNNCGFIRMHSVAVVDPKAMGGM